MKRALLSLIVPFALNAQTMSGLFDALKSHSQTKSDEILVKMTQIHEDQAYSKLYPQVNLFAKYDNYSLPTGMIPLAPNHMLALVTTKKPQPFSYNIYAAGVSATMPIFVKSIFTTADKAKAMQQSAKAKKRINLIKNEAVLVGANANLIYLNVLGTALEGKKRSLLETKKTVEIKVENGRAAASALYMINDRLNQIDIANNNIDIQKKTVISTIETLTGITLDDAVMMQQTGEITKNALESLKPMREKIKADRLDLRAQKEKLYPSLYAHGSYVKSYGESYNSYDSVDEEYGDVGVVLNIPIFAMSQYDNISLAQIEVNAGEIELQKLSDELASKAKMLEESLPLLENSKKLYTKSIEEKKKLLEIAKLNYTNARLSTEEYLRYEDDVVQEEANLYKTQATSWQTLMQLAVIYANNIEEIVK
ncbi:TolC family protein [Sulfurimonas sp. HSL3-2]|uniref:TolC family protein n=1 Tax=Hydrocurvibacter mobilis TaxID=3131936 RepID=UPI0031F8C546